MVQTPLLLLLLAVAREFRSATDGQLAAVACWCCLSSLFLNTRRSETTSATVDTTFGQQAATPLMLLLLLLVWQLPLLVLLIWCCIPELFMQQCLCSCHRCLRHCNASPTPSNKAKPTCCCCACCCSSKRI
jgi:hypothetical protein